MDIEGLQDILGITFKNEALLEQALVHDSYVNENPQLAPVSNERLEFLGDALLGLVAAEKLYLDFPHYTEGQMTRLRAGLVRREALARMAEEIGLGDHLYLGKGEEASGGRHKRPNLAGALEAVLGAIYIDQDLAAAKKVTLKLLDQEYSVLVREGVGTDYKSRLQETIQSQHQRTPSYSLIEATGPDHDRRFKVEVRLGATLLGTGSGKSKKAAESAAARDALEKLGQ